MQAGSGCEWNPLWFTSISPHAGLCLSQPHCVLFSLGDLEVSNSAIQIHCICYTLSSRPPVSPLPLLMPTSFSFLLTFPPFPASVLLPNLISAYFSHLLSDPICSILLLSITVPLLPDHISLRASSCLFLPFLLFAPSLFLPFYNCFLFYLIYFYYSLFTRLLFFLSLFLYLIPYSAIVPCPLISFTYSHFPTCSPPRECLEAPSVSPLGVK